MSDIAKSQRDSQATTLFEPELWEALIQEKEKRISLLQTPGDHASTFGHRSTGSLSKMAAGLLRRTSLGGLVRQGSNSARSIASYSDRRAGEVQAKRALGKLLKGGAYGERYVVEIRDGLLKLYA